MSTLKLSLSWYSRWHAHHEHIYGTLGHQAVRSSAIDVSNLRTRKQWMAGSITWIPGLQFYLWWQVGCFENRAISMYTVYCGGLWTVKAVAMAVMLLFYCLVMRMFCIFWNLKNKICCSKDLICFSNLELSL